MLRKKADLSKTQMAKDFEEIRFKSSDFGNLANYEEIDQAFEKHRSEAQQTLQTFQRKPKCSGLGTQFFAKEEFKKRPEKQQKNWSASKGLKSFSPGFRFEKVKLTQTD